MAFSRRGNVIEASVDDEDPRRGDDHNHNDDDDDDNHHHDPDCEIILSGSQWSRGSDDVPILPHWRNAQPSSVCILSHVNIIIIIIITFIINHHQCHHNQILYNILSFKDIVGHRFEFGRSVSVLSQNSRQIVRLF